MYVDKYHDGNIEVLYIPAHTGHDLGIDQLPALPLPKSVKNDVPHKLAKGIPATKIIEGMCIYKIRFNIKCLIIRCT